MLSKKATLVTPFSEMSLLCRSHIWGKRGENLILMVHPWTYTNKGAGRATCNLLFLRSEGPPWTPTMEVGWLFTPWALQALTQLRMSNFAPELQQVCCHTAKPWFEGQVGDGEICMAAAAT